MSEPPNMLLKKKLQESQNSKICEQKASLGASPLFLLLNILLRNSVLFSNSPTRRSVTSYVDIPIPSV